MMSNWMPLTGKRRAGPTVPEWHDVDWTGDRIEPCKASQKREVWMVDSNNNLLRYLIYLSRLWSQVSLKSIQKQMLVPAVGQQLSFELLQSGPCTLSAKRRGRALFNLQCFLLQGNGAQSILRAKQCFPPEAAGAPLQHSSGLQQILLFSSFLCSSEYYYRIVKLIYTLLISLFWDKAVCPWKSQNAQVRKQLEFLTQWTMFMQWEAPLWKTREAGAAFLFFFFFLSPPPPFFFSQIIFFFQFISPAKPISLFFQTFG